MKTIATDAFVVQPTRNRHARDQRRMGAMKRGIETGDLRLVGPCAPHRADKLQHDRLVQRRERREPVEPLNDRIVQHRRRVELGAAVNDAVSGGGEDTAIEARFEPGQRCADRFGAVISASGIDRHRHTLTVHFEVQRKRRCMQIQNGARERMHAAIAGSFEDSEFDRGRAGIDGEDAVHAAAITALP